MPNALMSSTLTRRYENCDGDVYRFHGDDADEEGVVRPSKQQIAAVEAWLREKFSGADVESGHIFNRDVVLFRARTETGPTGAKELEISDETFEDHTATTIIQALDSQDTATRLSQHPSQRLLLKHDLVLDVSTHGRHS